MPFAGLDLHKKEVEAAILPDHGNQPILHRFPATNEGILAFANSHLSKQHQVAVEATTNTWALVRLLQPLVHSVHVSNPIATHAIAKSKVKTDKVDALVLAQLLRSGFLPTVWTPDETTSELRRRCTERANLTHDRVRIKNRIHAILCERVVWTRALSPVHAAPQVGVPGGDPDMGAGAWAHHGARHSLTIPSVTGSAAPWISMHAPVRWR